MISQIIRSKFEGLGDEQLVVPNFSRVARMGSLAKISWKFYEKPLGVYPSLKYLVVSSDD